MSDPGSAPSPSLPPRCPYGIDDDRDGEDAERGEAGCLQGERDAEGKEREEEGGRDEPMALHEGRTLPKREVREGREPRARIHQRTGEGIAWVGSSPSPSWPEALEPQQATRPSESTAQAWASPILTATTPRRSGTAAGVVREA